MPSPPTLQRDVMRRIIPPNRSCKSSNDTAPRAAMGRWTMIKTTRSRLIVALTAFTAAFSTGVSSQTADDLKNDHLTPGDVLVYGMGYAGQRYSPLTQINKENIARLVPVWAFSITDNR